MTATNTPAAATPRGNAGPFAEETLLDPLPVRRDLREQAPVVYLERYGVYAVGRYAQMRDVLTDWQRFKVGGGVGLTNYYKEKPWRPPANPTETDPPGHDAPRRVLTAVLGPRVLRQLRERWFEEADRVVEEALRLREFDAVKVLACFPRRAGSARRPVPAVGRDRHGGEQSPRGGSGGEPRPPPLDRPRHLRPHA